MKCSLVAGDDAGLVVLAVVVARDETFALKDLACVLLRLRARVRVYASTTRQPMLWDCTTGWMCTYCAKWPYNGRGRG